MESVCGRGSAAWEDWYIGGGVEKISGDGETMGICRQSKFTHSSLHRYKVNTLIFLFQTVQQTHFHPEELGYTHLCGFRLNANNRGLSETKLWVSWRLRNQSQVDLKCLTHKANGTTMWWDYKHTWLTHHRWHLPTTDLHGLCRYNSRIKSRSIKIKHGVLGTKRAFSMHTNICQIRQTCKKHTCMKLYGPCICAMRSWTTCCLTTGSEGGVGVTVVRGWGSGTTGLGAVWTGCMELTTCNRSNML